MPVVFCGLFPADAAEFEDLRESLAKLRLNDSSFHYEPESSAALGSGFRCGFLGLLHLEVVQERLEREFNLDLIATAPSVVYRVHLTDDTTLDLHNPADMPDPVRIKGMEEPWIRATILAPNDYLGAVLQLCTERRGEQVELTYAGARAMVIYRLPLNEVIFDFHDRLKSITRGYASFDYEMDGFREGNLVKVQILINGEPVDAFSFICDRGQAELRGRAICARLKDLIPRQLFKIPLQAAIGGSVIARETISALRKDVTAKCYGGDITRKRKLLEKQKAGKKRMRQFGKVEIPQSRVHRRAENGRRLNPGTGWREKIMIKIPLDVTCDPGHGGEETPKRFTLAGRAIEIAEVADAWLAPDHRYFKVRGHDGRWYIIRHDVTAGNWELTMYDRTGAIATRTG